MRVCASSWFSTVSIKYLIDTVGNQAQHPIKKKTIKMTTQQNYNSELFDRILLSITEEPEIFSMTPYIDSDERKCIAGWALELNNISPSDNRDFFETAQKLLNLSTSEATSLFCFLGDSEYEEFIDIEERNQHTINILELILEKRILSIEEIIDAYIDVNELSLLQLQALS